MTLLRVLSAEALKLKRTTALRIVVIVPAAIIVLLTFLLSQLPGTLSRQRGDIWINFSRIVLIIWSLLMLPLYISLQTALLASLEHAENQWKVLLARPVPRWNVYVAKLLMVMAFVCASGLLLLGGIIAAGVVLRNVQSELAFPSPPVWIICKRVAQITGLAFLSLTIQHWISLRYRSFTVAVGTGIIAMIASYVMVIAAGREMSDWFMYFPWALPMTALSPGLVDVRPLLWFSGLAGLAVAAIGCVDFCRRDVN